MNENQLAELFPVWLKYLLDVCRPRWRENGLGAENPKAIALMDSFYGENDDAVMLAIKSYIATKKDAFIPFPGEIRDRMKTSEERYHIPLRGYASIRKTWPICPTCEEHTPNLNKCPFCADLLSAQKYNQETNHALLSAMA